jgi:hypothetical protein
MFSGGWISKTVHSLGTVDQVGTVTQFGELDSCALAFVCAGRRPWIEQSKGAAGLPLACLIDLDHELQRENRTRKGKKQWFCRVQPGWWTPTSCLRMM